MPLIGHKLGVQTWHAFDKWACHLLHGGVNMMNPWFKGCARPYTLGRLIRDTIGFTKYFGGGLTQGPIYLNSVIIHTTFGTIHGWCSQVGVQSNITQWRSPT